MLCISLVGNRSNKSHEGVDITSVDMEKGVFAVATMEKNGGGGMRKTQTADCALLCCGSAPNCNIEEDQRLTRELYPYVFIFAATWRPACFFFFCLCCLRNVMHAHIARSLRASASIIYSSWYAYKILLRAVGLYCCIFPEAVLPKTTHLFFFCDFGRWRQ